MRTLLGPRLLASLVLAALATGSMPGPSHGALTPEEASCRKRVGKEGRSLVKTTLKALAKCRDKVSKGQLGVMTDCTTESSTASKIDKGENKLTTKVTGSCPDAVVGQLVFGGDCYGVATGADLASCLVDTHVQQATELIAIAYGTPAALPSTAQKCQAGAAKEAQKLLDKRHKLIANCKDKVASGKLPSTTDCGVDVTADLAKLESKGATKIASKCPSLSPPTFGTPCTGVANATALSACTFGVHSDRDDALITVEYGSGPSGTTASAAQITNAATECVKGPLSRCRNGDYLLANGRIRVVVQDIQRNLFGIGQFGGQIIDADLNRANPALERDNFEELATAVNIENAVHYTALTVINDGSDGQPAVLRATGVDDLLDFLNPSSTVASLGFNLPAQVDDKDLPIEIQTDYILEPGANWVQIRTTVVNQGGTAFNVYLGEYLNGSGQLYLFQPMNGFGSPLVTSPCPATAANPCNFVAYAGYKGAAGVSYAYVHDVPGSSTFSTSGVTVPLLGRSVALALVGFDGGPNFPLAPSGNPGDSITLDRWFVVGDGSVSSITDARNQFQTIATGTVSGNVTLGGNPAAGAQVVVLGSIAPTEAPASTGKNVVTQAITDAAGNYSLTIPPGSYTVQATLDGTPYEGGGSTPVAHPVTVAAYGSVTQNMALPATGAIRVVVTDQAMQPLPAKASIVGFDPSPVPKNTQTVLIINTSTNVFSNRGPDGAPFGTTDTLFIDPTGDSGAVPLEPGNYQVVVSRGPEYSVDAQNVIVTAGATTTVNAEIARVIDSTGFVGSDFHVHSIESPDSQTARRDRVVTMLADGVDFFASTDHDNRTSYVADITGIAGASALLATAPGEEITSFDYGHWNAWPMSVDPLQVNGGAVDFGGAAPDGQDFPIFGNYSLTPGEIIDLAHADPGASNTVQVNHIHSFFGVDGGSGLAIDTGLTPPQSGVAGAARRLDPSVTNYFPLDGMGDVKFDALEIWIGDDRGQVYTNFLGQNAGDWINLLNQGYRPTGVADSDTHDRVSGASGFPRTFVASPTDAPSGLGAIADTLSQNVNDGRVFGSNGPMVRVRVIADSTSQEGRLELGYPTQISTNDGEVDVQVDVQSPEWAEFDTVELYVNSTTTCSSSTVQSGAGPVSVKRYAITPDYTQSAPGDFTISSDEVFTGHVRWEASTSFTLSGLTQDVWIVAMVKGTDGVSKPLFPVASSSLKTSTNTNLAQLTDGNLGEDGVTALAFTNPIYVDVDGGGWTAPGVQTVPCP
jgi:hypothetical protein